MRTIELTIGNRKLLLETKEFDGTIDVDDLTSIHYENIAGEVITIPVLLNRIGLLKSEAESEAKRSKLKVEIHESDFKRKLRREASVNGNYFKIDGERVKLSEKSLEEAVTLDAVWQDLINNKINSETDYEYLSVLYWSLTEKSKKLDNLIKGTTPEEFENSIVEGVINDIHISYRKSIVDMKTRQA